MSEPCTPSSEAPKEEALPPPAIKITPATPRGSTSPEINRANPHCPKTYPARSSSLPSRRESAPAATNGDASEPITPVQEYMNAVLPYNRLDGSIIPGPSNNVRPSLTTMASSFEIRQDSPDDDGRALRESQFRSDLHIVSSTNLAIALELAHKARTKTFPFLKGHFKCVKSGFWKWLMTRLAWDRRLCPCGHKWMVQSYGKRCKGGMHFQDMKGHHFEYVGGQAFLFEDESAPVYDDSM